MRGTILVDGTAIALDPRDLLGVGGEAEVYALPGDLALKVYKGADHPDFVGNAAAREAARCRLAHAHETLSAFPLPGALPAHIIQPLAPATDAQGRVIGYVMRQAPRSVPLARLADPASRSQGWDERLVIAAFRDLHAQVQALHRIGVVIGDFNDYNVLVAGGGAYLIDLDSAQTPNRLSTQFTSRFLDPLLARAEGNTLVLDKPYGPEADWYSFAVLLFQSLLFTGPYGGLYCPTSPGPHMAEALRPLQRLTIFDASVRYPKTARAIDSLPEPLEAYLRSVFARDTRGAFPLALLDPLPWVTCGACGLVHGRPHCPHCRITLPPAPAARRGAVCSVQVACIAGLLAHVAVEDGQLRWVAWRDGRYTTESTALCGTGVHDAWVRVARAGSRVWIGHGNLVTRDGEVLLVDTMDGVPQIASCGQGLLWLAGGALWEETIVGARSLGQVLEGRSYLWSGEHLALVYSEAGAISQAWVAFSGRPGLTSVALPRPQGVLERAHCLIGRDTIWLFMTRRHEGTTYHSCHVLDRQGKLLAGEQSVRDAGTWLDAPWGAMVVDNALYVPGECLVRVGVAHGCLHVISTFPDTAPFVDQSVTLLPGRDGIYVVRPHSIHRLTQR